MLAPLYLRDATGGARLRALVDEVRGAAGVGALPAVLFHVARDQAATGGVGAGRGELRRVDPARDRDRTDHRARRCRWRACAGSSREPARPRRPARTPREARALCAARDIHIGEAWVEFALGDLELSLGHPERRSSTSRRSSRCSSGSGSHDVDLVPGARARRRAAAARPARGGAGSAAAVPRGRDRARGSRGRARAPTARAGRWPATTRSTRGSRRRSSRHEQTLDRFEAARTRLAYGERLRRAGRRIDARVQLRAALEDFSDLGARRLAGSRRRRAHRDRRARAHDGRERRRAT